MSNTLDPHRVRFGTFELDEESGELWHGENDDRVVIRLAPQPARLLSHLIEKRPNLVTHDEIRRLLWPDVAVEFEEGLHTCVRKIRAALSDSPTDPQYVETVPRRGYRFVGTVDQEAEALATRWTRARRRLLPLAGLAGLILATLLGLASLRFRAPSSAPARIAVMPFEPIDETSALERDNDIAESVVKILANRPTSRPQVIGPTTTQLYDGRPKRIRELIADFDVDYVVNARESAGESGQRVLIEIIRGRDGAHVWANYLDELPAGKVAETIAEAVVEGAR